MQVRYFINLIIEAKEHMEKAEQETNAFIKELEADGFTDIEVKTSLSSNTLMVAVNPDGSIATPDSPILAANAQGQQLMTEGLQLWLLTQVSWWAAEEDEEEESTTKDTKAEKEPEPV